MSKRKIIKIDISKCSYREIKKVIDTFGMIYSGKVEIKKVKIK